MKLIQMIILEFLFDIGLLWTMKAIRDIIWSLLNYKIPINIYTIIIAIALAALINFKITKWE
ncbi:hypothetical protein ACUH7Y_25295 [Clostridium beijerinckii]|uniref:Uncharacterized protein n=1 Tax=Clostridium beijerinckii TaxID=1520 RepID=A0A7X9SR43_CLOBE|nr:hypothetical protein [Clostridium beijerinckii]NMF06547.1 hypothetical protein [Clostridium beijerinckii]